MHDPWTANYETGYEWFLIQQAKARNPGIKLYGLPWAFPQHVSCNPGTLVNCTNNPYDRPQQTADYMTSWVHGLKTVYGFDLQYMGSWNERGAEEEEGRHVARTRAGRQRAQPPSPTLLLPRLFYPVH